MNFSTQQSSQSAKSTYICYRKFKSMSMSMSSKSTDKDKYLPVKCFFWNTLRQSFFFIFDCQPFSLCWWPSLQTSPSSSGSSFHSDSATSSWSKSFLIPISTSRQVFNWKRKLKQIYNRGQPWWHNASCTSLWKRRSQKTCTLDLRNTLVNIQTRLYLQYP